VSRIDLAKPLYDNRGQLHALESCTFLEVVTRRQGCYSVWARATGESMMVGGEGLCLSNHLNVLDNTESRLDPTDNRAQP
jgi:hypothetical protein